MFNREELDCRVTTFLAMTSEATSTINNIYVITSESFPVIASEARQSTKTFTKETHQC